MVLPVMLTLMFVAYCGSSECTCKDCYCQGLKSPGKIRLSARDALSPSLNKVSVMVKCWVCNSTVLPVLGWGRKSWTIYIYMAYFQALSSW